MTVPLALRRSGKDVMTFEEKLVEAGRQGEIAYALAQLVVNDNIEYLVKVFERYDDWMLYQDPYLLEEHIVYLEKRRR